LSLLTFVIVARILGKERFGEWGILRATVAGFQVIAGFGMGATATKYIAELRRTDGDRAGRIVAMTGLGTLATGALAGMLLILLAPWVAARTLGAPHLTGELRVCGGLLLFSAIQAWQSGALAGFEAFRTAARVEWIGAVASFLLTAIGAWRSGLLGALSGMVIAAAFRAVLAQLALRAEAQRAGARPKIQGCFQELRIVWRFSVPVFIATAMVGPTLWLVQAVLVNQPGGYRAMAEFTVASSWRNALAALAGLLCAGYLPVVASLGDCGSTQRRRIMFGLAGLCGVSSLVAAGLVALLSRPILTAYGEGFESTSSVLLAVLAVVVIDSINSVVTNTLLAAGRAWWRLASNACWAAALVVSASLLVPISGALGLALAMLLAQTLHLVIQTALALSATRNAKPTPAAGAQSLAGVLPSRPALVESHASMMRGIRVRSVPGLVVDKLLPQVGLGSARTWRARFLADAPWPQDVRQKLLALPDSFFTDYSLAGGTAHWLFELVSLGAHRALLECGCGISTVVASLALARRPPLRHTAAFFSLEDDQRWLDRTAAALSHLGLERHVRLVNAPLARIDGSTSPPWSYDARFIPDIAVDLLFVDGPPGRVGRKGVLPGLHKFLIDGATILLDDARREGEVDCVRTWTSGGLAQLVGFVPTGSGLAVLRNTRNGTGGDLAQGGAH